MADSNDTFVRDANLTRELLTMKASILVPLVLIAALVHTSAWRTVVRVPHTLSTFKTIDYNTRSHQRLTMKAVETQHLAYSERQNPEVNKRGFLFAAKTIWDFTRPHTIIGSCISILSLFLFAVPSSQWKTPLFLKSVMGATIPSLLMNLYITGLNQVTDIGIDKINKPYLPLASGHLSKSNGVRIVAGSLLLALLNLNKMAWPLQYTLVGSALLGTVYSLPPFRLKRFPLLAAFCILVVRGSLINMGFYLQAKSAVLGETLTRPTSLATLLALGQQTLAQYPEAIVLTSFFAVFGVVIALMKDVPDVRGDVEYKIPSFSVKLGAAKMFRIAWGLLYVLLLTAASGALLHSTALNSALRPALQSLLPAAAAALPAAVSSTTQFARVSLAVALAGMARDVRTRALRVETDSPDKVFAYYMHIWNIFYACYLLLPCLRV